MTREFDTWLFITKCMIGLMFFIFALLVLSPLVLYKTDTFQAQVQEISYYGVGGVSGNHRVSVKLDNGMVLDVKTIPPELREGQTYTIKYKMPYLTDNDNSLIIISKP